MGNVLGTLLGLILDTSRRTDMSISRVAAVVDSIRSTNVAVLAIVIHRFVVIYGDLTDQTCRIWPFISARAAILC